MGEGASVGFHAAYILKSYGPIESSSGNAILGAYLNQLGLSEDAILYITQAAPTSIQWMNMDDAGKYGIVVGAAVAAAGDAAPPRIAEQRDGNAERRATDFVRGLFGALVEAERPKACPRWSACTRRPSSTTASRRRSGRSCRASAHLAEPLDRAHLHHLSGHAVGDVAPRTATPAA